MYLVSKSRWVKSEAIVHEVGAHANLRGPAFTFRMVRQRERWSARHVSENARVQPHGHDHSEPGNLLQHIPRSVAVGHVARANPGTGECSNIRMHAPIAERGVTVKINENHFVLWRHVQTAESGSNACPTKKLALGVASCKGFVIAQGDSYPASVLVRGGARFDKG
jgi:hypothetical protein